jgi:hypothetical protein
VRLLGLQQPLELGLDLRAGRHAELVAQQRPEPLMHAQRLDEVALRLAHAHQQQVAALAELGTLDDLLCRPLGESELGAAERQPRVAAQLARLQPVLLQPAARLVEPARLVAGKESRVGGRGDAVRRLRDRRPVTPVARRERLVDRGLHGVEVHARVRRELHGALPGVLHHTRAERPPQLGQHDVERLRVAGRSVVAPQRGDQPLARDGTSRVQGEISQSETALAAGEVALTPPPIDRDGELAAQFDGHFHVGAARH